MLFSGLIMSNANTLWAAKVNDQEEDVDDGILTADEIAQLDLSKTKLVSLSACKTGLVHENSEGKFGLQRAFKQAGVETLIMSLWDVSDVATADLMLAFYQSWIYGNSKKLLRNNMTFAAFIPEVFYNSIHREKY
jgi:CHAT domain-containing protein